MTTTTAPMAEAVPTRTWVALSAAILGVFMAVLDTQITNASLQEILGSLSASPDEGSWMSTAYLTAEVVAIPLTSFLIGVFGARAYILGNTALFLVASTLCGFAWNLPSMIAFRTLQGLAGGALIPTAMTLVMTRLPPAKRPIGFAWLMLSSTLAPTLGPTVGGFLNEAHGWPAIFFINWVPGVLMFGGVAWGLAPEPGRRLSALRAADWPAIAAMAIGLGALVMGLEEGNREDWFESGFIRSLAALAVGGIGAWTGLLLSRDKPFIHLRLFGRRNFGVSSVVGMVAGMGLYGSTFVLPLFLSQIAGYNALQIGQVVMWMGLPQILVAPLAATYARSMDNRVICSVGLLLFAMSCFLNAGMDAGTAGDQLVLSQVLRALGQPLIVITLSNFAVHRMEATHLSSASSLYNMSRVLGGAIGTAILATVITAREHLHSARIGEAVSLLAPETRERLRQLTRLYAARSGEVDAAREAIAGLAATVRREAFVMAFNDAFFILGCLLVAAIGVIWLADRVVAGGK